MAFNKNSPVVSCSVRWGQTVAWTNLARAVLIILFAKASWNIGQCSRYRDSSCKPWFLEMEREMPATPPWTSVECIVLTFPCCVSFQNHFSKSLPYTLVKKVKTEPCIADSVLNRWQFCNIPSGETRWRETDRCLLADLWPLCRFITFAVCI